MVCPACGTVNVATQRYCQQCGALLSGTPAPRPSAPGPTSYTFQATYTAGGSGAPLAPGVLLNGRYRITRELGTGGFGRVYLADDTQDVAGPPVAIKELLDTQFTSADDKREAVAWFRREVSTLLTLEHAGIPAIYSYWTAHTTSGPFYLAMEYIPGKTLEQVLQDEGGHVAWRRVALWGIGLCGLLEYLHSRTPPIVFRDMKPPNAIVDDRTGTPVLIDFGIARHMAPARGTTIGTPGYAPYEQWLGNAEPRSDLYALGAMLHALLTGRNPEIEYGRLTRNGLDVQGAMRQLFPSVDTLVPDVPPALARAITRATAFEADNRFPDAAAMGDALKEAFAPAPTVSAAPPPPATSPAAATVAATPAAVSAAAAVAAPPTPVTLTIPVIRRRGGLPRLVAALVGLVAVAAGLLAGALIGLAIVGGGTAATPHATVLAARRVKTPPASARLSQVRLSMLDAHGRHDIAALVVGAQARLRVHWTLARIVGHPRETITWRVTRRGRTLVDDHANDRARQGRAYWDDLLTVDRSWAGGPAYTAVGTVSVAGQTQRARLTFVVARPRHR